MKLGDNGVAFFVEEIEDGEDLPEYLATSPVPGASESDEEKVDNAKRKLTKKPEGRKKMPKTNAAR
jgi:phosphatidate phosphatase PAH1